MRIDRHSKRFAAPAVLSLTLALGACGGVGPMDFASLGEKPAKVAEAAAPLQPQSDLQKATEYWGKQSEKNPKDPQAAINYVRNLKALGAKQQALAAIQQAHATNPAHKGIASEYGRLALEMDQVSVADKLLAMADDAVAPDWKVISARGTVLAKQGRYREAIPQYERALTMSPNQPALLNNLALAHAMNGQADKAEPMLRQAAADGSADPKVAQNLSLVLGLQGKHDDAKSIIVRTAAPAEEIAEDARLVREMVGTQTAAAKPMTASISTSSMAPSRTSSKSSAKAKPISQPAATFEDATALVERLANNQPSATGGPIELTPKR
jgi:Flp pilus assembly protein TadD